MKPIGKMKVAIMVIVIILSCGTSEAQPRRWHPRPYHAVTVVTRPGVTVHVENRFTQKERFRIAMAYLKNHEYLTVNRYAKMTGLPKSAAKVELDVFATDKDRPIKAEIRGKKRVYTLKK